MTERPPWACACGAEHRLTQNRAWCFACAEWCYPDMDLLCVRGREALLEARIERALRALTGKDERTLDRGLRRSTTSPGF